MSSILYFLSVLYLLTVSAKFLTAAHINTNYIFDHNIDDSKYEKRNFGNKETVRVDIFYETLCPGCIDEYKNRLTELMKNLKTYVDLHTYPFGNARVKEENGKKYVSCQHGEAECYGNKLHACVIDIYKNDSYVDYNACLMEYQSNDDAADDCGTDINIDPTPFKDCAKSDKGFQLLLHYGELTLKRNLKYVPYTLINDKEYNGDLIKGVCSYLSNPPDVCKNQIYTVSKVETCMKNEGFYQCLN